MSASATSATKPAFAPKVAVARFLSGMVKVAAKTFPHWHEALTSGIEDCAISVDTRRALLEIHPLDDYYFSGIVALEAAKIRSLFTADEAGELLGAIGEQVDAVANRTDRVVSNLVFHIIGRLEMTAADASHKKPYDQVVKAILQHLGVDKNELTEHLMTAALYRHELGEPLALGVPKWWNTFHTKYTLTPKTDQAFTQEVEQVRFTTPGAPPPARRKAPRRAVAF